MNKDLKDQIELLRVYRVEQIEYDKTEFFSDVGGAAGLLLGISLTSLIGMLGELYDSYFMGQLWLRD